MKRILVSLLTALLVTAGLVGLGSSSPAAAACPYTGCLKTGTTLDGKSNARTNHVIRYKARVRTLGSSAVPRGTQRFLLARKVGGEFRLIKDVTRRVDRDGRHTYRLGKLRAGRYKLQLRYYKNAGSRWKNSRSRARILVIRPRR